VRSRIFRAREAIDQELRPLLEGKRCIPTELVMASLHAYNH
jgi:hypothetical protein